MRCDRRDRLQQIPTLAHYSRLDDCSIIAEIEPTKQSPSGQKFLSGPSDEVTSMAIESSRTARGQHPEAAVLPLNQQLAQGRS